MPEMSTHVEQRLKDSPGKGQESAPRIVTDEDFEQYLRTNNEQNIGNHVMHQPSSMTATENYLPAFYAPSSVNTGLPAMTFPYMTGSIADTWSTNGTSLFPNTNGAFSAMQDQMLPQNQAVPNAGYLNGLDHGQNAGLPSNIAYLNQQGLFFPGNTTDLSWGGPPQTSAGSILDDFYQQPAPVMHESNGQEAVEHKGVEHSFSGLNLQGDDEAKLNGEISQNGELNTSAVTNSGPPKPKSWAAIASQPAKPKPPPAKVKPAAPAMQSGNRDSSSWNGTNSSVKSGAKAGGARSGQQRNKSGGNAGLSNVSAPSQPVVPVLAKLRSINDYNPKEFSLRLKDVRFFIIKSYSEDDIHRSIKYSVWTSTEHGNRRLNDAFKDQHKRGPMYLLFSVNGSGHFCGIAEMKSEVEYDIETGIWSQEKWKGKFAVKWYYVKDVPNNALRHIRLENNDNKPVTNSRDTQEVPPDKGVQVVKIIHSYKNQTSIFDDFGHYEKRQEEEIKSKGKKLVGVEAP